MNSEEITGTQGTDGSDGSQGTTGTQGPTPYLESLSFELALETSKPQKKAGKLLNRFEEKDSKLLSVSIDSNGVRRWKDDKDDPVECDLEEKGFVGKKLILCHRYFGTQGVAGRCGEMISETVSTITNEVGYFTCGEVIDHILDFEKCDRPKTKWFGGIDCHHIWFEGLGENTGEAGDGYHVCWGS